MKRLVVIAIIGLLAWHGYKEYRSQHTEAAVSQDGDSFSEPTSAQIEREDSSTRRFRCDGRAHCSQMTSCAEAEFFLRSCAGVKMDGDKDGVPCEKQWC